MGDQQDVHPHLHLFNSRHPENSLITTTSNSSVIPAFPQLSQPIVLATQNDNLQTPTYNNQILQQMFSNFLQQTTNRPFTQPMFLPNLPSECTPPKQARLLNASNDNATTDHSSRNIFVEILDSSTNPLENDTVDSIETAEEENIKEKNYIYCLLKNQGYRGEHIIDAYKFDEQMIKKIRETKLDVEYKTTFCRSDLATIIIENEFHTKRNYEITHERFEEFVNSVTELFPREERTVWYSGSYRDKAGPKSARGILYEKYKYLRTEADAIGCNVRRQRKKKGNKKPATDELIVASDDAENIFSGNIDVAFEKLWLESHDRRKKVYCSLTLSNIFEKYPALCSPTGHKLFLIDFNKEFQDKSEKLIHKWPETAKSIIAVARRKKTKFLAVSAILDAHPNIINSNYEQNVALLLVPALIYAFTRAKKKIKNWRPSLSEITDSCVLWVQDPAKLITKQQDLNSLLLLHKVPLQPYVVICGSLDEVTASYAVIGTKKYSVSSPIEALDICFKSVKVLDMKFSVVSSSIWQFMRYYIYGFEERSVEKNVSTLISELKSEQM